MNHSLAHLSDHASYFLTSPFPMSYFSSPLLILGLVSIGALSLSAGCDSGCPDGSFKTDDGRCVAVPVDADVRPDVVAECSDNTDCDDGDSCNGRETCDSGSCSDAASLVCDDGDDCTADNCDSVSGCSFAPIDVDGDGYSPRECSEASTLMGGDCDDTVREVNPGATELCDAIDHDCDGDPENGLLQVHCGPDGDDDGAYSVEGSVMTCACPEGMVDLAPIPEEELDCDDTNDAAFPGQTAFFDAPCAGCALPFDYDCDGVEQLKWDETYYPELVCRTGTTCDEGYWVGGELPSCGEEALVRECRSREIPGSEGARACIMDDPRPAETQTVACH